MLAIPYLLSRKGPPRTPVLMLRLSNDTLESLDFCHIPMVVFRHNKTEYLERIVMNVYVVINAKTGSLTSIWSTADLAVEARDSLERLLHKPYTVVQYRLDSINEWGTYYD